MEVQINWSNSIPVLQIIGEIDAHTCPELKQRIVELVDGGTICLIVDLGQVDYIDSTGLGTLVGALKRASERDGLMALVSTNPQINKVLSITGLIKVFDVYDDVEGALNKIKETYAL